MNKTFIRILAILLAVLMAVSVIISVLSSMASAAPASQAALDALKAQREELRQNQKEVDAQINSLEYDQFTALAKKAVLDEQVELTQAEIQNINDQISLYDTYLVEKEQEIQELQNAEEDQQEALRERLRAMEENGIASYLAVILEASDFADLLSRMDFIGEIIRYDNSVFDALTEAREATQTAREELEQAKLDQEDIRGELEGRQEILMDQVNDASAIISEIESNISEYEAEYAELAEAEEALQGEIDEMVAELARQEAAANAGSAVTGTGTYLWPCEASRYVTSLFGTRLHPIYNTYKTHYGVDIGADYGTNVLASDTGTVVTATYDGSYGYYILINHGNGSSTLYAHMSKLLVSAGDTVGQGAVIGLIGSTGASTGPHLHFEVREHGERVNPLMFFSNYTLSPNA